MICFHGLEPGVGSAVEVDWSRQATDAHHSASGDRRPASPLFWDTMRPVQVSLFSVKVHSGHGHALIAPSTIAAAFFIIELIFCFPFWSESRAILQFALAQPASLSGPISTRNACHRNQFVASEF